MLAHFTPNFQTMSLYKELQEINKSIKREALDIADFRALLPNLLKKYKDACNQCKLHETMDSLDGIKPPIRDLWGNKAKRYHH